MKNAKMLRKIVGIVSIVIISFLPGCGSGGGGSNTSSTSTSSGGSTSSPASNASPVFSDDSTPYIPQATLEISPKSGTFHVGDIFSVDITVNTDGQNVVGVAAYLKYDSNKFQVVTIDSSDSHFPNNNENINDAVNGVIKIARGKNTPGVNSPNGKVARIFLSAEGPVDPAIDNVTLLFFPGSSAQSNVFMDDGLGTAILSAVSNARFTVISPHIPDIS